MKEPHSIEKQIEIVEHIIDQLNHCLVIYHTRKMYKEIKSTKNDIRKCKVELKRLIAKRKILQGEERHGAKI
jgi:hypothetical protein